MDTPYLIDGDQGWIGVDDRDHPSRLKPGIAAEAKNCRFERGEPWPRWCVNVAPWGHSSQFEDSNLLAATQWWEPDTGEEYGVVATDAPRSNGDGGRGKIFRVTPGGTPLEIEMGGYDVWGPCRLVPGRFALLLLRHGRERFYIPAANVNVGTNVITTNRAHGLTDGDVVTVRADAGTAAPLLNDTQYWVDVQSSTTLILCSDSGLTPIALESTGTRFALELAVQRAGPDNNNAAVLMLAPGEDTLAWASTWSAVPQSITASCGSSSSVWISGSHRFTNGQAVTLGSAWTHSTATIAAGTTLYVHELSKHTFSLHSTQAAALLGSGALTNDGSADNDVVVRPYGYSGQPIVPMREAVTLHNRLIGLRENADVALSDPGDFLHFTPYDGAKTAALGDGDRLQAIIPAGDNVVVLPSKSQVLGITNVNVADPSTWLLRVISREYGCVGPRAAWQVGRDVWMLSRNGVMSVHATDYQTLQGTADPVSRPIAAKINEIDWRYADMACGTWFDNKSILAAPLKGQEGAITNNCLFVYNHLNQTWDHYWQGAGINPIQWFRMTIAGAERLAWIDADGSIKWFSDDGWDDITLAYEDSEFSYSYTSIDSYMVTRGYTCGNPRRKNWHEAEVTIAHINPEFDITAITEGYNQLTAYRDGITKNPAKWLTFNQADYDPATDDDRVGLPYREDYSVFSSDRELVPEGTVFTHATTPIIISYVDIPGFIIGQTYVVDLGPSEGVQWLGTGTTIASDGSYEAESTVARIIRSGSHIGTAVTTTITQESAIALPGDGVPFDTHQVTLDPIKIRERSRMLQLKLHNTQGSVHWRSVVVAAKPAHGDW